jgi:hypothetical protein
MHDFAAQHLVTILVMLLAGVTLARTATTVCNMHGSIKEVPQNSGLQST